MTYYRSSNKEVACIEEHAPSRVVNDLRCPTNLSNDLFVGESCHVKMSLGVNTSVALELLECAQEILRAVTDIGANLIF